MQMVAISMVAGRGRRSIDVTFSVLANRDGMAQETLFEDFCVLDGCAGDKAILRIGAPALYAL
jgi:hypothetical protein